MTNRTRIEDEIDAIRIDFYDKTKDMTPSERIAYIKAQTASIHGRFNIHTVDRNGGTAKRKSA